MVFLGLSIGGFSKVCFGIPCLFSFGGSVIRDRWVFLCTFKALCTLLGAFQCSGLSKAKAFWFLIQDSPAN